MPPRDLDGTEPSEDVLRTAVAPRPKLSDILYIDLRARMSDGRLPPETRLPSEYDLCHQFGMSRPIVREALHRLRTDGFIRSRRGSGSFVREQNAPRDSGSRPAAAAGLVRSVADVRRVYEFRVTFEGGAAFAAAQNRSDYDLDVFRRELDAIDQTLQAGGLAIGSDLALHTAIVAATQNPLFDRAFASIAREVELVIDISRTRSVDHIANMQREHRLIVDHIRDGNASAARDTMQAHIRGAQERLFTAIHI